MHCRNYLRSRPPIIDPLFFALHLRPLIAVVVLAAIATNAARAGITYTPFGPQGEGGEVNGQTLNFGAVGSVYELDAFLKIAGHDLNGAEFGTSAQLSIDPLLAGLKFGFSATVSPDQLDLTLNYSFLNQSGTTLPEMWFSVFVDADIDSDFFDYEAGRTVGAFNPVAGQPSGWEIDEPGYEFGDIWDNLKLGQLDNTNAVPGRYPDDVSMALSFNLGSLLPGRTAQVSVLLSEAGHGASNFGLQQYDPYGDRPDTLTLSGTAVVVPEPASWVLAAAGLLGLFACRQHRRRLTS